MTIVKNIFFSKKKFKIVKRVKRYSWKCYFNPISHFTIFAKVSVILAQNTLASVVDHFSKAVRTGMGETIYSSMGETVCTQHTHLILRILGATGKWLR